MTTSSTPDRTDAKRTSSRRRLAGASSTGFRAAAARPTGSRWRSWRSWPGQRSPAEAADALKISLPRYYILETRALEGLVAACEPKPLGKQPSPETRIAALEKELQQAHRECARQQALVRVAQRSVGLPAAEPPQGQDVGSTRDRRGRKKRRPAVRALKAAETLRSRVASAEAAEVQPGHLSRTVPLRNRERHGNMAHRPDERAGRIRRSGRMSRWQDANPLGPAAGPSSGRIRTGQGTVGSHPGDDRRRVDDRRGL